MSAQEIIAELAKLKPEELRLVKEKLDRLNAESPIPQTGWGRALSEMVGKADDLLISPSNTIIIFTQRRSAVGLLTRRCQRENVCRCLHDSGKFRKRPANAAMFASPRPVRPLADTANGSRRDASDIDGLSREAERSGSELSQSVHRRI